MPISFILKAPVAPTRTHGLQIGLDSSPLTSTLSTSTVALIDGNVDIAAAPNWINTLSNGVGFAEPGTINGIDVYNWAAYGDSDSWRAADDGHVEVYKSNDNAIWTLVKDYDQPPVFSHSTGRFNFRCTFDAAETAKYFKVRNGGPNTLVTGGNAPPRASEIEVFIL